MKLDPTEVTSGTRWLFAAGAIALIFAVALYRIDEMLTHSPREKILGETLYQLRTAQSSIDTSTTDERLK